MRLYTFQKTKLVRLGYDLAAVCAVAQHCDENTATVDEEGEGWTKLRDATIAKRRGIRGVGDVIAVVTKAVGIKPCGKCQQRREKMN